MTDKTILIDGWTVELIVDVDGALNVTVSAGDRLVVEDSVWYDPDIALDECTWSERFQAISEK